MTDTGDTAWLLVVRGARAVHDAGPRALLRRHGPAKNVLGTMMHSFVALPLVTRRVGASPATRSRSAPDVGGVIGGLAHARVPTGSGRTAPRSRATVPQSAFAAFQMMFAVITPALIAGAFAERMRSAPTWCSSSLWSLLVYAPLAHWVWGDGGWLAQDAARSTSRAARSSTSAPASSALVCALVLGKRRGYPRRAASRRTTLPDDAHRRGHPLVRLVRLQRRAARSAANGLAALGVRRHASRRGRRDARLARRRVAAHGQADRARRRVGRGGRARRRSRRRPASCAGPGAADRCWPAARSCFTAVELKSRLGYDDSLDAVGVTGSAVCVGALLTGVFASLAVNPAGAEGGWMQIGRQGAAAGITLAFSFAATWMILKLVDRLVGFRLSRGGGALGSRPRRARRDSAYAFREHGRQAIPPLEGMTEEELAEMRERLVLEATARVLEAIGSVPWGSDEDEASRQEADAAGTQSGSGHESGS